VRERLLAGDAPGALALWRPLFALTRLLFAEPSPAAVKHWLWRIGLLGSPEVRLPMTGATPALAARLDAEILRRGGAERAASGGPTRLVPKASAPEPTPASPALP
jgi:4-hydroxy-tetrahydrodipicolinate synthase